MHTMSKLGDFVSLDKGLHPSGRLRECFFVPTPPSAADLTLSPSAASFSHPSASPLAPWLQDFAGQQLRGAIATASLLRQGEPAIDETIYNPVISFSPATADGVPPPSRLPSARPSPCRPANAAESGADTAFIADRQAAAEGNKDHSPRSTSPAAASPSPITPGGPPGSTAEAELATIAPPDGPNEEVCRGIETVDEVHMAQRALEGRELVRKVRAAGGGW